MQPTAEITTPCVIEFDDTSSDSRQFKRFFTRSAADILDVSRDRVCPIRTHLGEYRGHTNP
jgi:hypothetical protein